MKDRAITDLKIYICNCDISPCTCGAAEKNAILHDKATWDNLGDWHSVDSKTIDWSSIDIPKLNIKGGVNTCPQCNGTGTVARMGGTPLPCSCSMPEYK